MTTARNGSTHAWRQLRARKIRDAIRKAPGGVLFCEVNGEGPLDPNARPGSRYAIDVDHVTPIALGGAALPPLDELRITCPKCNRSAGAALSSGQFGRRDADGRRLPRTQKLADDDPARFKHPVQW